MTIRVFSFDMDGCLFNKAYRDSGRKSVIQPNQDLIRSLRKSNDNYTKSIVFLGSNRQSFYTDFHNKVKHRTHSCFPVIRVIAHVLEAELDTFLLADIYGDLDDGVSFARALNQKNQDMQHAEYKFDHTKLSIIYAQVHKIANKYPNEDFHFDFYDDQGLREYQDILEWLHGYFTLYPELLPTNCTLRLHHYIGDQPTQVAVITGVGLIDSNYKQTIKDMFNLVENLRDEDDKSAKVNLFAKYVEPNLLKNRVLYAGVKLTNDNEPDLNNKLLEQKFFFFEDKDTSNNPSCQNNTNNFSV
ncbi:MAG: hypothetical protein WC627_07045 [Legionella sp.]|jgi:hypothetical protein